MGRGDAVSRLTPILKIIGLHPFPKSALLSSETQDDNNFLNLFLRGGALGAERKIAPKTLFFLGKHHDNKISEGGWPPKRCFTWETP